MLSAANVELQLGRGGDRDGSSMAADAEQRRRIRLLHGSPTQGAGYVQIGQLHDREEDCFVTVLRRSSGSDDSSNRTLREEARKICDGGGDFPRGLQGS